MNENSPQLSKKVILKSLETIEKVFDYIASMDSECDEDNKMTKSRDIFVKSELEKICNDLDECYERVLLIRLENDNRFFKIFEMIAELSEKSNNLKQILRGRLV